MHVEQKIAESRSYVLDLFREKASTALVLGTGLSGVMDHFEIVKAIDYADIPHFPVSTVESHKGQLLLVRLANKHFIVVSGRFHFYEGYSAKEATYYVHVLKSLGIENIIFTNASGGLNPHYEEGEIVVINDHINLFPENPLRGKNNDALGPRFPDMMKTYDRSLIEKLVHIGKELGVKLHEGVYLGWQGPSLETPAEYRMARILGADLVGMSTIPEVIVAKYYDIKIVGISVVSNVCYPLSRLAETTIEEVIKTMKGSDQKLSKVLLRYLQQ